MWRWTERQEEEEEEFEFDYEFQAYLASQALASTTRSFSAFENIKSKKGDRQIEGRKEGEKKSAKSARRHFLIDFFAKIRERK